MDIENDNDFFNSLYDDQWLEDDQWMRKQIFRQNAMFLERLFHGQHSSEYLTQQVNKLSSELVDIMRRQWEFENKIKDYVDINEKNSEIRLDNLEKQLDNLKKYNESFQKQKKQETALSDKLKELEDKIEYAKVELNTKLQNIEEEQVNSDDIYANFKSHRTAAYILGNGLCFVVGIALSLKYGSLYDDRVWIPVLSLLIAINFAILFGASVKVKANRKYKNIREKKK